MKMRLKSMLMIGLCLICTSHVLRGQTSNSTSGGFMSQFNSWINRLRGNNNHNHNNNNNQSSDKDKETQTKNTAGQQMTPAVQYNMVPYPIMTGMSGMSSMSGMSGMSGMYSPMSPMTMSFAPRPIPSSPFGPAIPFGSLAASSGIGPSLALGSGLGSSMASSLAAPMASAMSSSYPGISQLSPLRPSYSSASHMMPVHHDYHDSNSDYQVGGYGGYGGLSSGSYGGLGGSGAGMSDHPISDSTYNGEPVEQNNNEEFSSAFSARNIMN